MLFDKHTITLARCMKEDGSFTYDMLDSEPREPVAAGGDYRNSLRESCVDLSCLDTLLLLFVCKRLAKKAYCDTLDAKKFAPGHIREFLGAAYYNGLTSYEEKSQEEEEEQVEEQQVEEQQVEEQQQDAEELADQVDDEQDTLAMIGDTIDAVDECCSKFKRGELTQERIHKAIQVRMNVQELDHATKIVTNKRLARWMASGGKPIERLNLNNFAEKKFYPDVVVCHRTERLHRSGKRVLQTLCFLLLSTNQFNLALMIISV